jgi:glutamate/tyrosine decarboxylase-like PLP-dependent enzyme
METAHAEGATIAAVVCCGGTVISFNCDDTAAITSVVRRFVEAHRLDAMPYLHFDGVIGWLYLSMRGASAVALETAFPDGPARERVTEVLRRCAALEHFDSLGVDFHKTGLCPYVSSFFVSRDRRFMDELGTGDYVYRDIDFEFGSFRTYRYTVENTRPTHGILSAWVNLRGLGREGYARYLASLHRGRSGLEAAIGRHGEFRLLNRGSLGWEVVIDIPFTGVKSDTYGDTAVAFMEHCWRRVRDGHELPLFSIVPEFHEEHDPARSRFAFLIYPMDDHPPELWDAVIAAIALERRRFERQALSDTYGRPAGWEKPIR